MKANTPLVVCCGIHWLLIDIIDFYNLSRLKLAANQIDIKVDMHYFVPIFIAN